MTAPAAAGYHSIVPVSRSGAGRWIAAGALLASAIFGWPRGAAAATTSYDVGGQAVVQVIGHVASITIRTWNRDEVQIEWPDGAPFSATKNAQPTRASFLIPTVSVAESHGREGTVTTTLLPEDFPVPRLTPGLHDVVRVVEAHPPPFERGKLPPGPPASLTLTIPETVGLVNVRSERGAVTLRDYHGTTIVADRRGPVTFDGVSGDAFVQPLNGNFYAFNSTFDRLRIRSNRADQIFDGCRVKQIEATTLTGSIIFDNGIFDPGLARLESDRGSIALGINGGAQIGARTVDGHLFTVLPAAAPAALIGRDDGDTVQVAGNGGPLVSASSNHGDLFLFEGSLTEPRPAMLGPQWRPMIDLLLTNRAAVHGGAALGEPPSRGLRPRPTGLSAQTHRPRLQ
jgi:hypothetical protein